MGRGLPDGLSGFARARQLMRLARNRGREQPKLASATRGALSYHWIKDRSPKPKVHQDPYQLFSFRPPSRNCDVWDQRLGAHVGVAP